jgi:hypothetical protein
MGRFTKCIVEFGEAWASAEDLVIEVAVTFVTSQGCHVVHFTDSLLVKNCQILMRLFELRISTAFDVSFDPYTN